MPNIKLILSVILWLTFFGANHQVHAEIEWGLFVTAPDDGLLHITISGFADKCKGHDANKGVVSSFELSCGSVGALLNSSNELLKPPIATRKGPDNTLPYTFDIDRSTIPVEVPCLATVSSFSHIVMLCPLPFHREVNCFLMSFFFFSWTFSIAKVPHMSSI